MIESVRDWLQGVRNTVGQGLISQLLKPREVVPEQLSDFARTKAKIRPSDVLLVEGRTQVGQIIQIISHSRWSHSAICVGKLKDFKKHLPETVDPAELDPEAVYLVEAELGKGTILTPIETYQGFRVRVCRAAGLSRFDQGRVACYVIKRLGAEYNVRQLADLARFMFPYGILPRKWRSTLFEHHAGHETKIVCSTLIADAFQAVKFPVLPILSEDSSGESRLFKRNPKLFAPSDFDISPYFDVLKFPKHVMDDEKGMPYFPMPRLNKKQRYYHRLPWAQDELPATPHVEIDPSYAVKEEAVADQQTVLAKKVKSETSKTRFSGA